MRNELFKKADEYDKKAQELYNQAQLLLDGTGDVWHVAYDRCKGKDKENFYGWLFKDMTWEKHKHVYNFRTTEPLTERQKEILIMENK